MAIEITIPRWHPAKLNALLAGVRRRIRLKRLDREMVTAYALVAGVPKAAAKRRVSLRITLRPGQRAGDPDAYWKSLLDALVQAGQLVDDSRRWVELGSVAFERGPTWGTTILLEDLQPVAITGKRRRGA